MYFVTMLNIDEGEVTDYKTIGYVSDEEEAEEKVRANDNAVFIKGEDSYYDYAIISDTNSGFTIGIRDKKWFKYNRNEQDVEVEISTGPTTVRRVDINIDEVSAPEGFEDYEPPILASKTL
jgi:hypothetical protein